MNGSKPLEQYLRVFVYLLKFLFVETIKDSELTLSLRKCTFLELLTWLILIIKINIFNSFYIQNMSISLPIDKTFFKI